MLKKQKMLDNTAISSFCQQIHMIVKAGFPVYYGISLLKDNASTQKEQALLEQLYLPLEAGASLSDALSSTGVFPDYMVRMIHLGEETGHLENVLSSLSAYYEREEELRSSLRHAVAYPLTMSLMMLSVLFVILTKVLPIFANVYEQLGSGLTGSALVLMEISTFLNQYLFGLLASSLLAAVLLFVFLQTKKGKRLYESKGVFFSLASGRFANCMQMALSSVLTLEEGFTLSEQLVENSYMQERIYHCRELVLSGKDFATALLESGIFSQMYANLITIGYKTSSMDEVMARISEAYERETEEKLNRFISLLEPALIVILSIFTGLILLSFLLPLLGIMSSIG